MKAGPESRAGWPPGDGLVEAQDPGSVRGAGECTPQRNRKLDAACILLLLVACALRLSLYYQDHHGDLSRPPVTSYGDQIDLFRIAYALAHGRGFSRDDSPGLSELFSAYPSREGALPYSESETASMASHGLLDAQFSEWPEPTASRDILYPYVASILAGTSDPFRALRLLNFCLVALNALMIFFHVDRSTSLRTFVLIGFGVGMLILAKKQFLLLLPIGGVLLLLGLWRNEIRPKQAVVAGVTVLFMAAPLFLNSWQVSHDWGLITGTNGWNDMPAAYSRELAEAGMGPFYKIRTASFAYYEQQTGRALDGEVERARAGKALFLQMMREEGFVARLPRLAFIKFSNEIFPNKNLYILGLMLAAISGFLLTLERHSSKLCLAVLLAGMLAVVPAHGGYGGMLFSTVVLQCVGVARLLRSRFESATAPELPIQSGGGDLSSGV